MTDLVEELERLRSDARWLDALDRLEEASPAEDASSSSSSLFAEIRRVGGEFREAQRQLADDSLEWEAGHSYLGTETKFRYAEDGTLWLSTEGTMTVDLFHAVSVVREVRLFGEWLPLVRFVDVVKELDFSRICTHFAVGAPLILVRDCVLQCAACNAAERDRSLYFAGNSTEEDYHGVAVPPRRTGFAFDRMSVLALHSRVEFLSPTSQRCKVVAAVDLRVHLPRTLVDFLMKRLVGIFLVLWRRQARRIGTDPDNAHRKAIDADPAFYREWLWPKYLAFLQKMNWTLPDEEEENTLGGDDDHDDEASYAASSSSSSAREKPPEDDAASSSSSSSPGGTRIAEE